MVSAWQRLLEAAGSVRTTGAAAVATAATVAAAAADRKREARRKTRALLCGQRATNAQRF